MPNFVYPEELNSMLPIIKDVIDDLGLPIGRQSGLTVCYCMELLYKSEGQLSNDCLACMATNFYQGLCWQEKRQTFVDKGKDFI